MNHMISPCLIYSTIENSVRSESRLHQSLLDTYVHFIVECC